MPYVNIDPSRYDAESPITESLMTDIIGNIASVAEDSWTALTGSGTYTVPTGVTKLKIICIGGGGGGGGKIGSNGATPGSGGGGSGFVNADIITVVPSDSISYSCGAGGASQSGANGSDGGVTNFGAISASGGNGGIFLGSGGAGANPGGAGGAGGSNGVAATRPNYIVSSGTQGGAGLFVYGDGGGGGGGGAIGFPFVFDNLLIDYAGGRGEDSESGQNGTDGETGCGGGGGGAMGGGGVTGLGKNGGAGIIFYQIAG